MQTIQKCTSEWTHTHSDRHILSTRYTIELKVIDTKTMIRSKHIAMTFGRYAIYAATIKYTMKTDDWTTICSRPLHMFDRHFFVLFCFVTNIKTKFENNNLHILIKQKRCTVGNAWKQNEVCSLFKLIGRCSARLSRSNHNSNYFQNARIESDCHSCTILDS